MIYEWFGELKQNKTEKQAGEEMPNEFVLIA